MTTTALPRGNRAKHLRYVSWIEETCREDPGARSALRAGLRQSINSRSTFAMHRLVARWLPRNASDTTQRAYYTVAALIAAQPRAVESDAEDVPDEPEGSESESARNVEAVAPEADPAEEHEAPQRWGASLGSAFAEAVTEVPGRDREMRESAAESRLNMLTRQSINGLHRSLPASVLYLRQLGVPVDWAQLLGDLISWPDHSGRIARRWLQDYYRQRHQDESGSGADQDQPPPEEVE